MAHSPNLWLCRVFLLTASLLVASCGGGGGGGGGGGDASPAPAPAPAPAPSSPTPLPELPASGTAFAVASDAGDPVGGGSKSYVYSKATASIRVTHAGASLQVEVLGDEVWLGNFVSPQGSAPLTKGEYANLSNGLGPTNANGSQTWGPEQLLRNCPQPNGSLKITEVVYSGEQITRLELDFEQRCGGAVGSLRGRLRWEASVVLHSVWSLSDYWRE